MTGIPQFFGQAAKVAGAVVITAVVVNMMSGQYKSQDEVAAKTFDTLRNSILTLMPDQGAEEAEAEEPAVEPALDEEPPETEITVEKEVSGQETGHSVSPRDRRAEIIASLPSPPPRAGVPDSARHDRQVSVSEADKWRTKREYLRTNIQSTDERVHRRPGMIERFNFLDREDFPEPETVYEKMGSVNELLLVGLESTLNNISLEENQWRFIQRMLREADPKKHFDLSQTDLEDLNTFTERFKLFMSLRMKMLSIAKELGAEKECGFHVPQLKINEQYEIVDYYQAYDCHPDLAERIMARIKKLPEWKKLVSDDLKNP